MLNFIRNCLEHVSRHYTNYFLSYGDHNYNKGRGRRYGGDILDFFKGGVLVQNVKSLSFEEFNGRYKENY